MRYFAKRILILLGTMLLVTMLAFLAFQIIPGDPVDSILGTEYTPEREAQVRAELGLDRPMLVRYAVWLAGFVTGDFGESYSYSMPVSELLAGKLTVTLTLTAMAFILILLISFPLGIFSARHAGGIIDRVLTVVNQVAMSVPPLILGIVFTYVFGLILKLFVPGNYISYTDSLPGFLGYMIFPAVAVAIPKAAMSVKLLRGSILAEMGSDYVRTARSKGNTKGTVLYRHVLRNAVIPNITFLAMTVADILAGSIIIERVFSVPGMGRMLLQSISDRDYPVVQTIVVIIAFVVVVSNFLADLIYQYVDPRIELR